MIDLINEEKVSEGTYELEFEYSSELESATAKFFKINENQVNKKMISTFIKMALFERLLKD